MNDHTGPWDYATALGARLRAVRIQRGLSLQGVEEKSRGRWKAGLLGSYERGSRMINIDRLAELAAFYGVPVAELLPGRPEAVREQGAKLVLDLAGLASVPREHSGLVCRWAETIRSHRDDRNGRVLTVRASDLRALAVLHDLAPERMRELLHGWGVLATGDRLAELTAPQARPYGRSGYRLRGVG